MYVHPIIVEPVESIGVDLDTLLIQLRPQVGPKWYQFGEAAGIPKDALNKIAEQCSPEECIVEVLDYWLRNTTRPTWKGIAWILKAINLQQLAFDIERVYSTGIIFFHGCSRWTGLVDWTTGLDYWTDL